MDINVLIDVIAKEFANKKVDESWIEHIYDCLSIADSGILSDDNINYLINSIGSMNHKPLTWKYAKTSYTDRLAEIINVLIPEDYILELAQSWPVLAVFMENHIEKFDSEMLPSVIAICK